MPSYRSFGALDDEILTDGDVGFVGINQRFPPNLLKSGEVVLSENGRIDGYWQPRRGIRLRSGELSNSAFPLRLPFWLFDTPLAIDAASRLNNVVTIEVTAGHGVTGDSYITLGDPSSSVEPIAGIVSGTYFFRVISSTELEFDSPGADDPSLSVDATQGVLGAFIDDDAVSEVFGSCLFSDPQSDLEEFIVLATNLDAKLVSLEDSSVVSLPYPADVIVRNPVNLIQAFDKVILFRDGQVSLEWSRSGRVITAAVLASNVVTVTSEAHGLTQGDKITLSGLTFTGADPNGEVVVASVTDADNFTFALTSANETYGVTAAQFVPLGFTKVLGGAYTAQQGFSVNHTAVSVTDGVLSVTVSGNTSIKAGDKVFVHHVTIPQLEQLQGENFQVVEANATTIKFPVPAGNYSGSGSGVFDFGGRFSVGGGFSHMPAPPWAVYFQRRLWVPYWYEAGGTKSAPTYDDRGTRDEIMASDILDSDTYDKIFSQFRITAGVADYLVAMQPFYEDALIVLNRNSLHLIRGTQGTLEDTVVTEMTREVGCLARMSVASRGPTTFFLSDDGVYGIEFVDEYNLRGIEEPLSITIQPVIDRINRDLAKNSVAVFFNNRYWIAVPLDSSVGSGDATGNNSLLIYNTLNRAWESIDTYDIPSFNITNLVIGQNGARNTLYLINDVGGIHEVDSRETPVDVYSVNILGDQKEAGVKYKLVTRGYMLGGSNFERKRFTRAQVQLQAGNQPSNVDFLFSSEDPDTDRFLVNTVDGLIGTDLPAHESGNFRMRLGNPRGLFGTLTISASSVGSAPIGRPKVNSITIDGSITNRQTYSQT